MASRTGASAATFSFNAWNRIADRRFHHGSANFRIDRARSSLGIDKCDLRHSNPRVFASLRGARGSLADQLLFGERACFRSSRLLKNDALPVFASRAKQSTLKFLRKSTQNSRDTTLIVDCFVALLLAKTMRLTFFSSLLELRDRIQHICQSRLDCLEMRGRIWLPLQSISM
jgi:hypothetical protein